MNESDQKLGRLMEAARKVRSGDDTEAPLGFATRVVAEAFARPIQSVLRVWETLSWRFLGGACAVMLMAVIASRPANAEEFHEAEILVELLDETFELALFP